MQTHIGFSGWFYWPWRGIFYPDTKRIDTWFKHYATTFNTVELNAIAKVSVIKNARDLVAQ